MPITSKNQLATRIRHAKTHAALLRIPGNTLRAIGEREAIAALLDDFCDVCERFMLGVTPTVADAPTESADAAPSLFEDA